MSFKASTNHQLTSHPLPAKAPIESAPPVEQLLAINNELVRKLETREQENTLLNEVISTVGSTLRLDEVLRNLVDTVVRATSCDIAFIYLFDADKERLVLASTNEKHRHMVGKISMNLGEGIAGWVALHRKAVFLTEEALEDPRFFYVPELEEEKFQSIMSVPVITKNRHLIGVINVQAVAPHEFTEQHRTFITNTASLVASAIENAQLYENTQRKLNTLTTLSVLSQTISSGLYLDDMLRSLATLTVQLMEVDLTVIMLMDQAQARERDTEAPRQTRRLTVRATAPNLNDRAHFQPIDVDNTTLEHLRNLHENHGQQQVRPVFEREGEKEHPLERLNPVKDTQYRALLSAPLIAGTEQLGLINCYSNHTRRFSSEDQTLLTTIANQAAIAIKNSYLVNQLAQKNLVKGFFDDLMHGTSDSEDSLRQRAHFLGCDLSRPHAAVMIEIAHVDARWDDVATMAKNNRPERNRAAATPQASEASLSYSQGVSLQAAYRRMIGNVRRRVQDNYTGAVFYEHENLLTCIIPLSKDPNGTRLKNWLKDLANQMHNEYDVLLSIGIGNTCQHINDYRRGFAEASEALQMGQASQSKEHDGKNASVVTHFNDLGVYRYLYKIAHMDDLRDVYQDQIAHIDSYDQRKNTDLLDTLETYLECAGNLTKTSERLFVHRNTLIQRLERLQSLCDIDLQDRGNWLTLQVAIKVYKLRNNGS